MRREPIDYNNPLGISKREWTMVLGVNLALLLTVYAIAIILTLTGNDTFLLNFHSADLDRIENMLREANVYPIVQMLFSAIELTIICSYIAKAKPKWWFSLAYFGLYVGLNVLLTQTTGGFPAIINNIMMIAFYVASVWLLNFGNKKEKWFIYLFRGAIALAVSFILNEAVSIFRTKVWELWHLDYANSSFFALSIEYDLALALSLGFLTLVITWKKGEKPCPTSPAASGSSPTTMNSSPKSSKIAKNNLSPKLKKRLRWLKAKVMIIQTTGLAVIAALPWFAGRPVEFALVYVSFCFTRLALGFNRSLHYKSELSCITIGALTFWALTFLTPSAETSIILSLCYGAGLALGFRLYWELHDLMMYRKAAKTDRYAMFYTAFKGDISPKHINGVMRAKGFTDKDEIEMVQMYMQRLKVEYIADYMNFARITIEKHLTELAERLYEKR